MKTKFGPSILDEKNAIIIQQVNCRGVMGAGLAAQIRSKWPVVFDEYKKFIEEKKEKHSKEKGYFHSSLLLGEVNIVKVESNVYIANLFGQDTFGAIPQERDLHWFAHTNPLAFELGLQNLKAIINKNSDLKKLNLWFPYKIGCGLGGGNWELIEKMIAHHFPEANIYRITPKNV